MPSASVCEGTASGTEDAEFLDGFLPRIVFGTAAGFSCIAALLDEIGGRDWEIGENDVFWGSPRLAPKADFPAMAVDTLGSTSFFDCRAFTDAAVGAPPSPEELSLIVVERSLVSEEGLGPGVRPNPVKLIVEERAFPASAGATSRFACTAFFEATVGVKSLEPTLSEDGAREMLVEGTVGVAGDLISVLLAEGGTSRFDTAAARWAAVGISNLLLIPPVGGFADELSD